MGEAATPRKACCGTLARGWTLRGLRTRALRLPLLLLAGAVCLIPQVASAQDGGIRLPNIESPRGTSPKSAFPKQQGGIFGARQKIDRAQPLYVQTDRLVYDDKTNRVIAEGNVEIYYNNYILTAD